MFEGMLTSLLHILALALNQFIGIVYPLRYRVDIIFDRSNLAGVFSVW